MDPTAGLSEKHRLLRLETLYDLALGLHDPQSEQELVEELLQRACPVLDPRAAAIVSRGPGGHARAVATAGWTPPPEGAALLSSGLWQELLLTGGPLRRRSETLCDRDYASLLAVPIPYRGTYLGFIVVLDKESRRGGSDDFTAEDSRYLESVAALAGVTLDEVRRRRKLEAEREQLAEENRVLRGELSRQVEEHRIVATAEAMRTALERLERVAPRGVTVLLRGESGTGKELFAKLLHLESGRQGPLVALNCAALPESLLESELFGIEAGVATGVEARRGKVELADGGTLFLDEIGDLPTAVQVKLLRVLQEREVTRVGGAEPMGVDARLVAATHQDLERHVADGTFREDLYYRLQGVEIRLPPLRDRREDIPHLVRYFLERFCRHEGIPLPEFTPEALSTLQEYDFPGNVRELQNLVEAATSLGSGRVDGALLRSLIGRSEGSGPAALDLATVERRHIRRVLAMTDGNKTRAAEILGIDRRTLQRRGH